MSKSKRKAGGCTHGRFKLKKMGKGWATHRRVRGRPLPIDRSGGDGEKDRDAGGKTGDAKETEESGSE